jgi:hypothetical protein
MTAPAPIAHVDLASPLQFIVWRDVLVMIDDCSTASAYEGLRSIVVEQSARSSLGLGCLVIVPDSARAPSAGVRDAMNETLMGASLRCLCWLVEGVGFQGAMVRAVLTGLWFSAHARFPAQFAKTLDGAVRWMLPHLEGGPKRLGQANIVAATIRAQRATARHIVL